MTIECEDEDSTYVKLEFVEVYEDTDDDGEEELVDCYFEEETDTGLVWVSDWESKEGEECDPISVELEYAEGWFATKMLAYGGEDCDEVIGPVDEYVSELENDGGNQAAISNLQFCVAEPKDIIGDIALAYEDLPKDDSDWDVNDWQVDLNATFLSLGSNDDGTEEVTQLTFDIIPQARGAMDDHAWRMDFLADVIGGCPFTATLEKRAPDGSLVNSTTESYGGSGDFELTVWESTNDALDDMQNSEWKGDTTCDIPQEYATLTIDFDTSCDIDVPTKPQDLGINATELFFDPVLDNQTKSSVEVHQGDVRLVAVPDAFLWPVERIPIWDAYTDVSEDTSAGYSQPSYDDPEWYNNDITETDLVTNCNFEIDDEGELYIA